MAYDETVVERVRQIIAGRTDVVEKRMVGGRSFMVGGHLCCGVAGSDLMVRVGSAAYRSALGQPHMRLMQFAGRPLFGYVPVAPEGYRATTALEAWLQRASTSFRSSPRNGREAPRRPRIRFPRPLFGPLSVVFHASHASDGGAW